MTQQLRYGHNSTLPLDVSPEALVADCTSIPGDVLDDPAAAVAAALLDPLGYPPLTRAVVPGDRITIAVAAGVPQAAEVVAGVVHTLMSAKIRPADIVVLRPRGGADDNSLTQRLPDEAKDVTIVAHDPADKGKLSYLAALRDAEPIYLNRYLTEADVIIPISVLRPRASLGYTGIHSGLYPTFSDEATQDRFRAPTSLTSTSEQKRRREEADEVAWLLGIQMTVQIVPGPGDSMLHVLAGLIEEVADHGLELVESVWSHEVPSKAELVVAAIEGAVEDQSWENFGRALYAASQVCADHGTIVLCTDLQCRPGPSLQRLAGCEEDSQLLQRIRRDRSEDALSASLLLETRARQHIYLLSRLDEGSVEALGVGYVTTPEQVNRLTGHAESCILLADAHRAAPKPVQRK